MNEESLRDGNWLYRNPSLFEEVNGHLSDRIADLIWRELGKTPPNQLGDVLDVGCGTGRLLRNLFPYCNRTVGVDVNERMLDHARANLPQAQFHQGDMRSLNVSGLFDIVICVGSVIMYMQSNDEILQSLINFRKRLHPDGFLLLGLTDAGSVIGDHSRLRRDFQIKTAGVSAKGVATYQFDGERQCMIRNRVWYTSATEVIRDEGEYRLIFPLELDLFLATAGFSRRRKALLNGDALQPRRYVIAQL